MINYTVFSYTDKHITQDFESERKWKLAQAKKVAIRASKGLLEQATRGEKKVKVLCFYIETCLYEK